MNLLNHGIIGNCTSAALIKPDTGIEWLCLPFFDSSSVFAKILDEQKGGVFRFLPEKLIQMTREYVPQTAILKTLVVTEDGSFEILDYMPRYFIAGGRVFCAPEVHRYLRVISGSPKIKIQFDARPNYALGEAKYQQIKDYIKITSQHGEYNSFYMYSNFSLNDIQSNEYVELKEDSYFVLSYHQKLMNVNLGSVELSYQKTKTYWMDWVHPVEFPEKYRDFSIRSLITLKLLMFERTGAVIAAPTTSIPEMIGTERNWDYRYCWVRDASMIIDLYLRLDKTRSATMYIRFILSQMLLKHDRVSVMYGINGEKTLTEFTLDHLAGYGNSKPVRVGNAAYNQRQNDLCGELIETIYTYFVSSAEKDLNLTEEIWTMTRSLVNDVRDTWKTKDSGIWERRNETQHYVHSKLMNWVAMDRAAKIAQSVGENEYAAECFELAHEIHQDILDHGWSDEKQSFTMYYGSKDLDAAVLLMLHYGFLPEDDPRMISTVDRIYQEFVREGLVLRYAAEDDFGEPENAFIVCTFWMINALNLVGRKQEAQQMLDKILSNCNELKLLSEDVELKSGRLTGNFPQGYSHLAMIQSILLLSKDYDYDWSDHQ